VQFRFRRKLQASCLGNRDKVAKMPQFQMPPLPGKHTP
jgi:hypothetical protein